MIDLVSSEEEIQAPTIAPDESFKNVPDLLNFSSDSNEDETDDLDYLLPPPAISIRGPKPLQPIKVGNYSKLVDKDLNKEDLLCTSNEPKTNGQPLFDLFSDDKENQAMGNDFRYSTDQIKALDTGFCDLDFSDQLKSKFADMGLMRMTRSKTENTGGSYWNVTQNNGVITKKRSFLHDLDKAEQLTQTGSNDEVDSQELIKSKFVSARPDACHAPDLGAIPKRRMNSKFIKTEDRNLTKQVQYVNLPIQSMNKTEDQLGNDFSVDMESEILLPVSFPEGSNMPRLNCHCSQHTSQLRLTCQCSSQPEWMKDGQLSMGMIQTDDVEMARPMRTRSMTQALISKDQTSANARIFLSSSNLNNPQVKTKPLTVKQLKSIEEKQLKEKSNFKNERIDAWIKEHSIIPPQDKVTFPF